MSCNKKMFKPISKIIKNMILDLSAYRTKRRLLNINIYSDN